MKPSKAQRDMKEGVKMTSATYTSNWSIEAHRHQVILAGQRWHSILLGVILGLVILSLWR